MIQLSLGYPEVTSSILVGGNLFFFMCLSVFASLIPFEPLFALSINPKFLLFLLCMMKRLQDTEFLTYPTCLSYVV